MSKKTKLQMQRRDTTLLELATVRAENTTLKETNEALSQMVGTYTDGWNAGVMFLGEYTQPLLETQNQISGILAGLTVAVKNYSKNHQDIEAWVTELEGCLGRADRLEQRLKNAMERHGIPYTQTFLDTMYAFAVRDAIKAYQAGDIGADDNLRQLFADNNRGIIRKLSDIQLPAKPGRKSKMLEWREWLGCELVALKQQYPTGQTYQHLAYTYILPKLPDTQLSEKDQKAVISAVDEGSTRLGNIASDWRKRHNQLPVIQPKHSRKMHRLISRENKTRKSVV